MEIVLLGVPVLLALVGSFAVGVVMIVGGLKMMRLSSYRWATAAGIAALLPCSPVGLLGLVVGIWSLIVLNRRNVIAAFAQQNARGGRSAASAAQVAHSLAAPQRRMSAGLVLLGILLLLLLPLLGVGAVLLGHLHIRLLTVGTVVFVPVLLVFAAVLIVLGLRGRKLNVRSNLSGSVPSSGPRPAPVSNGRLAVVIVVVLLAITCLPVLLVAAVVAAFYGGWM